MTTTEERLTRVETDTNHMATQVDLVTAMSALSNQITALEGSIKFILWAFGGVFLLLLAILARLLNLIPGIVSG